VRQFYDEICKIINYNTILITTKIFKEWEQGKCFLNFENDVEDMVEGLLN